MKYRRIVKYLAFTIAVIASATLLVYTAGTAYLKQINQQNMYIWNSTSISQPIPQISGYIVHEQPEEMTLRKEFIIEFLSTLSANNLMVMVAANDEASILFDDILAAQLHNLGMKENLQQSWFRHAYAFVINRGQVVFERLGEDSFDVVTYSNVIDGVRIDMSSAGYDALIEGIGNTSININGEPYSLGQRGLNIVIFDWDNDRVLDSVSIDTHLEYTFRRAFFSYQ